jgi:hypothetical protein
MLPEDNFNALTVHGLLLYGLLLNGVTLIMLITQQVLKKKNIPFPFPVRLFKNQK